MAFRDTLSKVASTVGGRANNAIESGKLNLKIGSEERKIADYTRSIGALLVERLDAGEDFGDEVAALYESIKASRDVIAAAKAEIEENKQENEAMKQALAPEVPEEPVCPACGTSVDANANFCPQCGSKIEIDPAPAAECEAPAEACACEAPAEEVPAEEAPAAPAE